MSGSDRPGDGRGARPRDPMDDDRPTILHDVSTGFDLHLSRSQRITGRTIVEIVGNPSHNLSRALGTLVERARQDLHDALLDDRATLDVTHEFEFERRVGYRLCLMLFDPSGGCVEVSAQLDQDGRAIRRGTVASSLVPI